MCNTCQLLWVDADTALHRTQCGASVHADKRRFFLYESASICVQKPDPEKVSHIGLSIHKFVGDILTDRKLGNHILRPGAIFKEIVPTDHTQTEYRITSTQSPPQAKHI
jgi:hypothetical protein